VVGVVTKVARLATKVADLVARLATRALLAFSKTAALWALARCARNNIRETMSQATPSNQHAGHAVRRNRTRSAAGTFIGHSQHCAGGIGD